MSKRNNRKMRHLIEQGFERQITKPPVSPLIADALEHFPELQMTDTPGRAAQKSSELLLEFARPILKGDDTAAVKEVRLKFAMIGWNLAASPEEVREKALNHLAANFNGTLEDELDFRETLEMLIQRKLTEFPHYQRIITGVRVTQRRDKELYVEVAAVMSEEERSESTDLH
jgi:hypothetical protein